MEGAIYNDGRQLLQLLNMRGYYREWMQASRHYREKRYEEAARLLNDLLGRNQQADIYRFAIVAHIQMNDMPKAYALSERLEAQGAMQAFDFAHAGFIKCYLGDHDAGMADFEQALALDPDNVLILNNRGFALSCMERYAEAVADLDRAIELAPEFASAYNSRGLARMKMGRVDEGLADIHHSLKHDEHDPYIYRNLGIYHIDRGEFSDALEVLNKARDINPHTLGLEECITMVERGLGTSRDA
jgi:tetratricopeptide (TPR) repeat protein